MQVTIVNPQISPETLAEVEFFGHILAFLKTVSLITGRKVEMLLKNPIAFSVILFYIPE